MEGFVKVNGHPVHYCLLYTSREEAATEYVEVEVIEEKATCPHCGQDAPREAKFCPNCGGLMEIES